MPAISIIIPIYKVEQYIEQCLDSVIHQSFPDIEIICIDDCGEDLSLSIVEDYASRYSRIQIIKHTQNKGLAQSRNAGIEAAQGDYIFFVDSDDYLQQDALENLYKEMQRSHADVVIAKTKVVSDYSDREQIPKQVEDMKKYLFFDEFDPYRVTWQDCCERLVSLPCIAWGKLYSMSFLRAHSLRFIKSKVNHEDEGFHIKLFSMCPVVSMIEEIGVVYRLRKGSIMHESTSTDNSRKRSQHTRLSLYDAFNYIWRYLPFVQALKLISSIQSHDSYRSYFTTARCCPYIIIWTDTDKLFKLFGVELCKCKTTKSGRRITKVLKVPVYIEHI